MLWERFQESCDYVPLTELEERHELFAEVSTVET